VSNGGTGTHSSFESITISGGEITARGGNEYGGAGIGGGADTLVGNITISGGRIYAFGGANDGVGRYSTYCGAGIGGGDTATYRSGATITISGGTIYAAGGWCEEDDLFAADIGDGFRSLMGSPNKYKILISGSSTKLKRGTFTQSSADSDNVPRNASYVRVYEVVISGFVPDEKADIALEGYGTNDIYADADGKIYLWLAEGDYLFTLDGVPYRAHVTSSGAVVEPWFSGVYANGTDLRYLHDENGQWTYNFSDRTLYILSGSSPADCVTVSGTNTEDFVHIVATNDVSFVLSNLNLKTTSSAPVFVKGGTVTVMMAGTNVLDATGAADYAGLQVAKSPAMLVITNLEENAALEAKGGLRGAGIGGGSSVNGICDITVRGGAITARGGSGGAGIGGGYMGRTGRVYVYGGNVTAVGGNNGAGIGGGTGCSGVADIYGGVVNAASGSNAAGIGTSKRTIEFGAPVTITGGAIYTEASSVHNAPTNSNDEAVYPVDFVAVAAANAKIDSLEIVRDGNPFAYGTNDIYADTNGTLRVWLPDGDYGVTVDGVPCAVTVDGAAAEATRHSVLESLKIESIVVGDNDMTLVVSSVPDGWAASSAELLRVRAGETLPLADGDDALLPVDGVSIVPKDNGTAVVIVPRTSAVARFFRVEVRSP